MRYQDLMRKSLLGLKFSQQTRLCKLLGNIFREGLILQKIETVGQLVPIPLPITSLRQLQFKQYQSLKPEIQQHKSNLRLFKAYHIA